MISGLSEDEIKDVIECLESTDCEFGEDHSKIINILNNQIEVNKKYEKENKILENQEIWIKVFYNGYFYQLKDMSLAVDIRIPNPNFGPEDRFTGTTKIFCPIDADEDGNVDLTPLLHTFLMEMKNNPNKEVKAYATGFMRQLHFNKDLLNAPIPQGILDMFSFLKKDEGEVINDH